MEKAAPVPPARNGEESKAFYVSKLGLTLDFEWRHEPGGPVQICVHKGDVYLHLSDHSRVAPGAEISICVEDVVPWARQSVDNGINIEQGPRQNALGEY